jgi:ADP-heptose:LPS heptosyltransferase
VRDFVDLAAYIDQLDLIISIDSAPIHLAGALGKPVWVLLAAAADTRWELDRTDSEWYESLRIFRQRHANDWAWVIEQVRQRLCSWAPHAA